MIWEDSFLWASKEKYSIFLQTKTFFTDNGMLSDLTLFLRILFWAFVIGFAFPLIKFAYHLGRELAFWLKKFIKGDSCQSKDKSCKTGASQSVGKAFYSNESRESLDFNGVVELSNVTLHDSLNVNGEAIVSNCKINKISSWGRVILKNSQVSLIKIFGALKVNDARITKIQSCGELKLDDCTVEENITLESISVFKIAEIFCPKIFGCKVKILNTTVEKNLIINDSLANQKLSIYLENSSIVGGIICPEQVAVEVTLVGESFVGFTEGNVVIIKK